ncbi:hypothetical protein CHELA20_52145 [Hyphomicrobiales bacterium]|nr:hypothetical protein CHELA41_22776 [Hyphomicrobiales bacterium]CAH1680863.1 hypothetical protein CHELA20_52145 [Hyphomicrobiales bacterium]
MAQGAGRRSRPPRQPVLERAFHGKANQSEGWAIVGGVSRLLDMVCVQQGDLDVTYAVSGPSSRSWT